MRSPFADKEPAIYTYADRSVYEDSSGCPDGIDYNHIPYSTFQEVCKAVKKEHETDYPGFDLKSRTFYVYKRRFNRGDTLSVQVSPDGEIVSTWDGKAHVLNESDNELFNTFSQIFICIPVLFCKGDILTYGNGVFVLTDNEWEYGQKHCSESRQYLAHGTIVDSGHSYKGNEVAQIHWDFDPATLDLEYFRDKLTGYNRVLKAICKYMKNEISVDLMMNAYDIILHEEQEKASEQDEGLELAGLLPKDKSDKEEGNE